jgi:hypothetical protein
MEGRWLPGRCVLWGSAGGMLKKSWSIIWKKPAQERAHGGNDHEDSSHQDSSQERGG